MSAEDGVRKWQWFLAVEPGPELRAWLREQNPFGLADTSSPQPVADSSAPLPLWFPAIRASEQYEVRQAEKGKLTLLISRAAGTAYAADSGDGFAVAAAQK